MKTLNLARGMVMLLALTITLTACQKDIQLPEIDDTPQYFLTVAAGDCDCVGTYEDSEQTFHLDANLTLTVWNDGESLHFTLVRGGHPTNNFNNVWFSLTETSPNAGNRIKTGTPVTSYSWDVGLGAGWENCAQLSMWIKVAGLNNSPGNEVEGNFSYYLRALCELIPPDCEEWDEETAFGGSFAGAGNAWWYYFDTEGSETQPIYTGQHETDGTVTWTGTHLVIDLGSWSLQDDDEAVKVQGYDEVPTERPAAGLFNTYKGNELTIEGDGSRYYVIHLDVRICND